MIDKDRVYLNNILDCIHQIEDYTSDMDEQAFNAHPMAKDAVLRNLEVMGEATKLLSTSARDENEDIPWKRMPGMRDKLIHNYMGVDYGIVWDTINDILPLLETQIIDLLEESGKGDC